MRANTLPHVPGIMASQDLAKTATRAINQCQVYYSRSKLESAAQAKLHAFFVACADAVKPGAFAPPVAPVAPDPDGKMQTASVAFTAVAPDPVEPVAEAAPKKLTPAQARAAAAAAGA